MKLIIKFIVALMIIALIIKIVGLAMFVGPILGIIYLFSKHEGFKSSSNFKKGAITIALLLVTLIGAGITFGHGSTNNNKVATSNESNQNTDTSSKQQQEQQKLKEDQEKKEAEEKAQKQAAEQAEAKKAEEEKAKVSDTSNSTSEQVSSDSSSQSNNQASAVVSKNSESAANVTSDSNASRTVYWTPNGKSYHYNKNCPTLSRSKTILEGPLSDCPKSDPCDKCVK